MNLPVVQWFTDRSVVVFADDPFEIAHALNGCLVGAGAHDDIQVRPGLDRVLVESFMVSTSLKDDVSRALQELNRGEPLKAPIGREHIIPVRYDGIDIEDVGNTLGLSRDAVIMAHTRTTWRVGMLGFAPGFPYLIPSHPNPWNELARRESPRTRVPAGSVAVAAGMSAIYPNELPGGWQIIGTTDVELFTPQNASGPTLLQPGDTVLFEAR